MLFIASVFARINKARFHLMRMNVTNGEEIALPVRRFSDDNVRPMAVHGLPPEYLVPHPKDI
jgi:hypothetical protein